MVDSVFSDRCLGASANGSLCYHIGLASEVDRFELSLDSSSVSLAAVGRTHVAYIYPLTRGGVLTYTRSGGDDVQSFLMSWS